MRILLAVMAMALVGCASNSAGPSASVAPTAASRTEFARERDAICIAGSDDIAVINATMDTMSQQDLPAAFRQIADRIRAAQADLDAIAVPAELADFVAADSARRAQRIELVTQLAVASIDDPAAMDSIDTELTALNIETESEEDAHGLRHCP